MNPLHDELKQRYEAMMASFKKTEDDPYRLHFHVMPPTGWLNDPNGAIHVDGVYHLYYQYSPYDAAGGLKYWGHYTSRDLVHFKDNGLALLPDQPYDLHGVYSGSAFEENGVMHYFYTGNVKHLGDHDYILSGREQNTIHAVSYDKGMTIEKKDVVIDASDYPAEYSNHIRDPKIRKINDVYYMILGARNRNDEGLVILYQSTNLTDWTYHGPYFGPLKGMGYMWECPDFFELDGEDVLILSPQGVNQDGFLYQNVYQSGYYLGEMNADEVTFTPTSQFNELDRGFDFYAPQTFEDEAGNHIMWAWMGLPDADYDNPLEYGWQHAMTLPRVLTVENHQLIQKPHPNYQVLRKQEDVRSLHLSEGAYEYFTGTAAELLVTIDDVTKLTLTIRSDVTLTYDDETKQLTLALGEAGRGRKTRTIELTQLKQLQCFIDQSSLEVFINDGEYVMTSRMYPQPDEEKIELTGEATGTLTHWLLEQKNKS
ncbi:beta-fructofuranosidase [Halolactibacillus halophilus]|uniref:Sucrose-6-phosphate hydrolase n=1 Tax=Halolactibacillus halophilus TaxID=306540 RepID=A0A1I5PT86_9BACI|nr:sucrose-6-phosphate hydrolase [Halolactibacillus halophilus]GEM01600.1 sucrose-6-phosphate hydrolase [Halolactibacillus halophilus]SFP36866.1 beta-fructofuranosidase [Halolactibacillus halophilus]